LLLSFFTFSDFLDSFFNADLTSSSTGFNLKVFYSACSSSTCSLRDFNFFCFIFLSILCLESLTFYSKGLTKSDAPFSDLILFIFLWCFFIAFFFLFSSFQSPSSVSEGLPKSSLSDSSDSSFLLLLLSSSSVSAALPKSSSKSSFSESLSLPYYFFAFLCLWCFLSLTFSVVIFLDF